MYLSGAYHVYGFEKYAKYLVSFLFSVPYEYMGVKNNFGYICEYIA